MRFIGQKHIMNQLDFLLPTMYKENIGDSILLCAASGQGKTHMARLICQYLADDDYQEELGNVTNFDPTYRVHFIDEAHTIPLREFESFYPIMDSKQFVIVLASNEFATLPEPVINRCNNSGFVFTQYTLKELIDIVSQSTSINYSDKQLKYIIKSGGNNPRVILGLVRNLEIYFRFSVFPNRIGDFKRVLRDVFGIVDGIEPIAGSYIEALSSLGGTASISTLAGVLKIDADTLKARVEPLLLSNNLIRITSKGRTII